MKFTVDAWDPAYDVPAGFDEFEVSTAGVQLDVELPAANWRPIVPTDTVVPKTILFVDGVRRIDARVWIESPDGDVQPGICASYAAGVVRCDGLARVDFVECGRGIFSALSTVAEIDTAFGLYRSVPVASKSPDALSLALQERMGAAEQAVVNQVDGNHDSQLLVVDGPLRGHQHCRRALGFIKTHYVAYLPSEQHRSIGRLQVGQRTPVFCMGTTWSRFSWYLRLPGLNGGPWAGIARCEASADLSRPEVISLANSATAALPRFASESHKDARAPQNLYPVAGLERELRRRLGDQQLLYRALRLAAGIIKP